MSDANVSERYFAEKEKLEEALYAWQAELELQAKKFDPQVIVSGRVKSHRSVMGKIYKVPAKPRTWESLGDLVALKAIFPTQAGVAEFTSFVRRQDKWNPVLDTKPVEPNELKYQAMQFDLAWADITDVSGSALKIELQVRSAAADAWYVVDHRLKYKGVVPLPVEMQRKLSRLIVLTELFDEEVTAVMRSQASLPEYAIARIYQDLIREMDQLIDGHANSSRPEGLLEILLNAFTAEELPMIDTMLTSFLAENRIIVQKIIRRHLYNSKNFVEYRDWLYYEPETLIIAERAVVKPAKLRAAISGSDFEAVIAPMITELSTREL